MGKKGGGGTQVQGISNIKCGLQYYKEWFEVLTGDESLIPEVSVESTSFGSAKFVIPELAYNCHTFKIQHWDQEVLSMYRFFPKSCSEVTII